MSMEGAYTELNYQSSTLADFGCKVNSTRIEHGYYSSSKVWVFDGIARTYQLVKAAGTGISKNLGVVRDAGTTGDITVVVSPASGGNAQSVWGINNTGDAITNGNYFWLSLGPMVYWQTDAALAINALVMPSNATAGNCELFAATTTPGNACCGIVMLATGAAGPTNVWGRFPSTALYIS